MEVVFYEKPRCATNTRQCRLLETAGHTVVMRNVLSEPWTAERAEPLLIRRPLMEIGTARIAGFDLRRLRELIGLEAPESAGGLEGCTRVPGA
ncbi:MAG: hypothetical protein ABSD02_15190 [Steroidobacteraceae bacterium]|jgi:arsenate reductase-like glutaredoxin family protein